MKFSVSCAKCGTYRVSMRLHRCQYCYGPVLCWQILGDQPAAPIKFTEAFEREGVEA